MTPVQKNKRNVTEPNLNNNCSDKTKRSQRESGPESNLPEGWRTKCLHEISPRQSVGLVINPSTYFDSEGTVPLFVGSNISENSIDAVNARKITRESNDSLMASRLYAGDLVVVRVGDPGTTAVVPPDLDSSNCASMMIIRRSESFDSYWLCHLMNSEVGRKRIETVQYGTAQKQFNISDAINFSYPVPPQSEQKAIAKALSDTDALIAALEKLITKKRAIKTATMQQLLTGKTRLPGFGEGKGYKDTELGRIPEDWEVLALGQTAKIVTGSTPSTRKPEYYGGDVFFVSPADLGANKYIESAGKSLSSSGIAQSRQVPAGSTLFTCIGSTIGKCAIAKNAVCFNQQINAVIAHEHLSNQFLYYQLVRVAPSVRISASEQAVPIVNKSKFSETLVSMPPTLKEQIAISNLIGDLDHEIVALEEKLAKNQKVKTAMMQQLLTGRTRLI